MNYEIVDLEEKIVVGITARTGNNDPECQKVIGSLWQDFMSKGIWESMKNKANEYCIGLYSNYDFTDMTYDVTIGAEVTQADTELNVKKIPGGKFALFRVKGDVVKAVSEAWEKIWAIPLERSFAGDFEEYVSNENGIAEINIYVALK
ncbi:MAG: GyrI-like domain-containing protein [Oscillospiraceae bacterium]|nr:GyrI-like domain-containing protein [Oscillospiraceae bacterium]